MLAVWDSKKLCCFWKRNILNKKTKHPGTPLREIPGCSVIRMGSGSDSLNRRQIFQILLGCEIVSHIPTHTKDRRVLPLHETTSASCVFSVSYKFPLHILVLERIKTHKPLCQYIRCCYPESIPHFRSLCHLAHRS